MCRPTSGGESLINDKLKGPKMSNEFMRADPFLRSELDYRANRVRDGVRRNRRLNRTRRLQKTVGRTAE
jgi:hypothetical protein